MKAELKYLHSPDILDLNNYCPKDNDNFAFLLQMIVGQENSSKDGESFDIFICTPKWLLENKNKDEIIIGLHYIIMFEYSYERLHQKLNNLLKTIKSESWIELGGKLSRIGKWEFEDYIDI